jgi:ParB-like chromosome segregation protein Spo0J
MPRARVKAADVLLPNKRSLEYLPIDALIPYANNARTHSDGQIAAIAASIKEFSFTNPVLIDAQSGIIAGHGRVLAARLLDMAEVPCIRLPDLTATQRRALVLADNKLALHPGAGWDFDMLRLELEDLKLEGFDLALTGFSDIELDSLLGDPLPPDDPEGQWEGMPEYEHEDQTAAQKIIVHFATPDDVAAFAKLVGQKITGDTKYIWFPQIEIKHYADKRYMTAAGAQDDEP